MTYHPGLKPQGFSSAESAGSTPAEEEKQKLWDQFAKVAKARDEYLKAVQKREGLERDLYHARNREDDLGRRLRQQMETLQGIVGAPHLPEDLAAQ